MSREKIIVDCDAGVDDALALLMLISAHKQKKIEIMAITCVTGNTYVDNVINNVFRILHICDISDIPVHKGADSALLSTENAYRAAKEQFHGSDGFGDIFTDKPDISKLKEEHAVCALQRITTQYCGKVTLLCLAPLTNVALAIKMFPDFTKSVKRFLIMGGNITAVGNITAQAEFNFYADPESVHIVIHSAGLKLWLLPWETCLKSRVSHEWRNDVFGAIDSPAVKLMNAIDVSVYRSKERMREYYSPCDAFVAGVLLRPDVAKDVIMYHIDIELTGLRTRGQVVIDHLKSNKPNAHVIRDIDTEIFKELLLFTANPSTENSHILSYE